MRTTRTNPRLAQYRRLRHVSLGTIATVVITACAGDPTASPSEMFPVLAKGGTPNDCGSTALSITFRDDVGDALRSDGNGPYVEGIDGSVHLNAATGRLMLWMAQDDNSAPRVVNVTTTAFNGSTTDRIYTNGHQPELGCGFKDMANGSTGSAVLEAELDADGIIRYGKACDGSALPANRVGTTRSTDGLTWMITGASGIHCKRLSNKPVLSQVGTTGPFAMTLVTVP